MNRARAHRLLDELLDLLEEDGEPKRTRTAATLRKIRPLDELTRARIVRDLRSKGYEVQR